MKIKNLIFSCVVGIVAVSLMSMLTGCSAPKDVAYFQDVTTNTITPVSASQGIKIMPGDKISIVVKAKDSEIADLFNLGITASRIGSSVTSTGGKMRSYTTGSEGMGAYTVSPEGTIDFPVLGNLTVSGMSRSELAGFIKGELMGRELVKDPVVTVEFLNTGVSVLGEVLTPGRYDVNLDQFTIFDAISLAGDLTIQGQRKNVKVLRKEADGIHTYVVDLTDMAKTMSSPAYYLKQGDLVYVEPNGVKKRQTTVNGNTALSASFWVSVASLLTSVAVLIFK